MTKCCDDLYDLCCNGLGWEVFFLNVFNLMFQAASNPKLLHFVFANPKISAKSESIHRLKLWFSRILPRHASSAFTLLRVAAPLTIHRFSPNPAWTHGPTMAPPRHACHSSAPSPASCAVVGHHSGHTRPRRLRRWDLTLRDLRAWNGVGTMETGLMTETR
jgi:hypothetical protein